MQTIHQILKQYWGYDNFRSLQAEIITAILENKDTLALLPTGGGKSICFQVPALAKEGICLVVSPLIALIRDQIENLKNKGIPALAIYTGMNFIEIKKTMQNAVHGNYKFLYVSPERLHSKLFLEYLPAINISLIAVDEAHCISQWGYDFRPSYLQIASIREQLPKIPILALTASATLEVQNDICEKLLFSGSQQKFQQSFERPNLSYSVFNTADKINKLLTILNNVQGTAIVYCKSRKHTKDVADLLKMKNINADYYHAGLTSIERSEKQIQWIKNHTRVMVCTNAFGMGIDKPDVRIVVHYNVPDCIENYYQEAGRAGRDGQKAYAVLLCNDTELKELEAQIDVRFPSPDEIKNIYIDLMNYLQIAAGSGEGLNYDFDVATFSNIFKLNILTVVNVIKTLGQEGLITYTESFFKPSTVIFNTGREDLMELEKQNPYLDEIVKGLLRTYEGIFDSPCTIYETQLSKFLKKPIEIVKNRLEELHKLNFIVYNPQKDKAQIILLRNRMYTDNYKIDSSNYKKRKEKYYQKVLSILKYAQSAEFCRSKFLAKYFSDIEIKDCNICDNCINKKDTIITTVEFNKLKDELFSIIVPQQKSIHEILAGYANNKKHKLNKVINYLIEENKLKLNKDGYLVII